MFIPRVYIDTHPPLDTHPEAQYIPGINTIHTCTRHLTHTRHHIYPDTKPGTDFTHMYLTLDIYSDTRYIPDIWLCHKLWIYAADLIYNIIHDLRYIYQYSWEFWLDTYLSTWNNKPTFTHIRLLIHTLTFDTDVKRTYTGFWYVPRLLKHRRTPPAGSDWWSAICALFFWSVDRGREKTSSTTKIN